MTIVFSLIWLPESHTLTISGSTGRHRSTVAARQPKPAIWAAEHVSASFPRARIRYDGRRHYDDEAYEQHIALQ